MKDIGMKNDIIECWKSSELDDYDRWLLTNLELANHLDEEQIKIAAICGHKGSLQICYKGMVFRACQKLGKLSSLKFCWCCVSRNVFKLDKKHIDIIKFDKYLIALKKHIFENELAFNSEINQNLIGNIYDIAESASEMIGDHDLTEEKDPGRYKVVAFLDSLAQLSGAIMMLNDDCFSDETFFESIATSAEYAAYTANDYFDAIKSQNHLLTILLLSPVGMQDSMIMRAIVE